jgi:thioredoxin 1
MKMHSVKIRIGTVVALAITVLALGGCGEDAREAPRTREGSAVGEAAVERVEGADDPATAGSTADSDVLATLPRLVDLGKDTCIPCKMMAPILEEVKQEYEGRAVVEVIDLRENSQAGADYGLRVIPTQIFFDSEGREVWRHEGFLPKEQIVAKFAEMGVKPLDE